MRWDKKEGEGEGEESREKEECAMGWGVWGRGERKERKRVVWGWSVESFVDGLQNNFRSPKRNTQLLLFGQIEHPEKTNSTHRGSPSKPSPLLPGSGAIVQEGCESKSHRSSTDVYCRK